MSELGGSSVVTVTGDTAVVFRDHKEIDKPAKTEPFTSVNVFNLAAFVPLLHSISANILAGNRAGSNIQRNSSFQGRKKKK